MINLEINDQNDQKVKDSFDNIAIELFNNYDLIINGKHYSFIELEFYYYSENHPDGYTHPHENEQGKWRAHNFGLDITLESKKDKDKYGGILIRSIKKIDGETEYINGPRKVVFEIFKNFKDIYSEENQLQLCKTSQLRKFKENEPLKSTRIGLGKPNIKTPNDGNYKNCKYRYIVYLIPENKIDKKEETARVTNNDILISSFLGYNLNK